MKVKLDEDMPRRAVRVLESYGHEVATVSDEGLSGASDVEVARRSSEEGRLLITLDRGFGDIRRYPPSTHPGIIVVRLRDQRASLVERAVRSLLATSRIEELVGCVASLQPGALRVRRPEE